MFSPNQQNTNHQSLLTNNIPNSLNSNKVTNSGKKVNQTYGNFGIKPTNQGLFSQSTSPPYSPFTTQTRTPETNIFTNSLSTNQNMNQNIQPNKTFQQAPTLFGFTNGPVKTIQDNQTVNGTYSRRYSLTTINEEKTIKGSESSVSRFISITADNNYGSKSLEELRREDYLYKRQSGKANNVQGVNSSIFTNSYKTGGLFSTSKTNIIGNVANVSDKGFSIGANPKPTGSTPSRTSFFPANQQTNQNQIDLFNKQPVLFNQTNTTQSTPTFGSNSNMLFNNQANLFNNLNNVGNSTNQQKTNIFSNSASTSINNPNIFNNNQSNNIFPTAISNQTGVGKGNNQVSPINSTLQHSSLTSNPPTTQQVNLLTGQVFKQPMPTNPVQLTNNIPQNLIFNTLTTQMTNQVPVINNSTNFIVQPTNSIPAQNGLTQGNTLSNLPSIQPVMFDYPQANLMSPINNYVIYPSTSINATYINESLTGNVLGLTIDQFVTKKIYEACSKNKTLDEILSNLKEEKRRDLDSRIESIINSSQKNQSRSYCNQENVPLSSTKKHYDFLKIKRKQDNREIERILQTNRALLNFTESGKKRKSANKAKEEWIQRAEAHEYKRIYNSEGKIRGSKVLNLDIGIMNEEDNFSFSISVSADNIVDILKDNIVEKLVKDEKYKGLTKKNFSIFHKADILLAAKPISLFNLKSGDKLYIAIDEPIMSTKRQKLSESDIASIDKIPALTRSGYHTKPAYPVICRMSEEELQAIKSFEIYNEHGCIKFKDLVDIRGLNLDNIVQIEPKKVRLYENQTKPPKGEGLNVACDIYLYNIKSKSHLSEEAMKEYKENLIKAVRDKGATLVDYNEKESTLIFSINELNI
jgi:hypothetical protein